jgi:hypothetical protein
MAIWKLGGLACAAMLGSALLIGPASAMPANGLATVASKNVTSNIQDVRLVCGPYRCWNTWGPRRWGANRWSWNRWGWGRGQVQAMAGVVRSIGIAGSMPMPDQVPAMAGVGVVRCTPLPDLAWPRLQGMSALTHGTVVRTSDIPRGISPGVLGMAIIEVAHLSTITDIL